MGDNDLTLHVDGHPGHRGNVLAHALLDKLDRLLSALSQAERQFHDIPRRKTDYEIVAAAKVNPTQMTFRPVPKVAHYDPIPAYDWSLDQFDRIATDRAVDARVDASLAETLVELAHKKREDECGRAWITRNGWRLDLDDAFKARSQKVAAQRRRAAQIGPWYTGQALGSVVGELRQVGDADGENQIVIFPPVGAERIECTFDSSLRDAMKRYLWHTVRVTGILKYQEDSAFPVQVVVKDVTPMEGHGEGRHLMDLRGLFRGRERDPDDWGSSLDVI